MDVHDRSQHAGRGERGAADRPASRRVHRPAAGPGQPHHRPLAGDGRGRPAALPRLPGRPHAVPARAGRRSLPGRERGPAARRRPRRRPARPLQGGRGGRLRRVGGLQARADRRRRRLAGDDRRAAGRPARQGHPHRAARRADLALEHEGGARALLRRAPRAGYRRGAAWAAGRVHPAGADPERLQLDLLRVLLHRDDRRRDPRPVRAQLRTARRPSRPRRRPSGRPPAPRCASSGSPASARS
jgi:hypothetical protein